MSFEPHACSCSSARCKSRAFGETGSLLHSWFCSVQVRRFRREQRSAPCARPLPVPPHRLGRAPSRVLRIVLCTQASPVVQLSATPLLLPLRAGVALLAQKQAISNWPDFAAANGITGWQDLATVCWEWTGVNCTDDRVTSL